LSFESVKLGRFIVSIEHPHLDNNDLAFADAPKAVTAIQNHYTGLLQGASNAGFASALTSLMSSGISKRATTSIRVKTDQVKTYTLENSVQRFIEAMNLGETRKWVENAIDQGRDIYLVVGFHTVSNACIIQGSLQRREAGGQIKLPIGLSLAAIGPVVPLENIIDPYVAGNYQVSEGGHIGFLAPGEQICALQYLKVCHRWLSSCNIDNTFLSKALHWKTYYQYRGDEEEENIVEVEAIELEELVGNCDREVASEGDILLLSLSSSGRSL
jgi:hypothetical protein